jgi:Maltokinase N-terminal cap domain
MARLHHASLTPSKSELLAAWLPSRPWAADLPGLKPFASYRLDDPDGEVGLEGILLSSDAGEVVHVPLTYRAAPLEGAEAHLVGTTEHAALGTRWVYDATGDPVWRATLAATILAGGTGAEEYYEVDGRRETREPTVQVAGSGATTASAPGDAEVVVVRRVGEEVDAGSVLAGSWEGGSGVLAYVPAGG